MNRYEIKFPTVSGDDVFCYCYHISAEKALEAMVADEDLAKDFLASMGEPLTVGHMTATPPLLPRLKHPSSLPAPNRTARK